MVTGANLAGSGLAATVGNGTLVLAVETLNQNTTGSAATLTTARAINGVDFDGSAPITVTAAGSTLSDTVTVAKGGTGATTFTSGHILRGNGTSALTSNSDLMFDGNNLTIQSNTSEKPVVSLNSTNSDAEAPVLQFMKGTAGADGDDLGKINFEGFDPDGNQHIFAQALGEIVVAANGSEEGKLTLNVASHDAELQPGLILASGNAEDEVDVTIGNGATSTTTIAGDLKVNGTDIYGPTDGDLNLRSDGNIALFLDGDGDESSQFQVINDASGPIFTVTEAGVGALNGEYIVTGGKVNVASEAQAPIGMQIARRTITTAEANAMNSTPIELIPAQGANTIIEISNVIARVDRAATQTNSAADMNLHYADKEPGTYGSSSICHFRRFAYNETTDVVERRVIAETTSALTLTEDVNKAVEVSFDAATTTNCFTSIDMYVTYFVIDIS